MMPVNDAELVAVRARAILKDCASFAGKVALDDWPECARELAFTLTAEMRRTAQSVLDLLPEGGSPADLEAQLDELLGAVDAVNSSLEQSVREATGRDLTDDPD